MTGRKSKAEEALAKLVEERDRLRAENAAIRKEIDGFNLYLQGFCERRREVVIKVEELNRDGALLTFSGAMTGLERFSGRYYGKGDEIYIRINLDWDFRI